MLQHIKDLMKIKEELDALKKKFDDNKDIAQGLKDSVESLKIELESLKGQQSMLSKQLKDDSLQIKEIKEDLRKEINDFKLLKSRLEIKIVEKFEEEIRLNLFPKFERLDKNVKQLDDFYSTIEAISKKVNAISPEIQKFNEIAQNIKKEDFELSRFANQLRQADSEKLQLMQKIDTLERLIGKMRRNMPQGTNRR